jgi:hypothetical protein
MEELKARPRITRMGMFSLTGWLHITNCELEQYAGKKTRERFLHKNIEYCGKKWSVADIFEGKMFSLRNYEDKRCGLQGIGTNFWKPNYHRGKGRRQLQHALTLKHIQLSVVRDYLLDSEGNMLSMAYMSWVRQRELSLNHKLINEYFGYIPDRLNNNANLANKWCRFRYNKKTYEAWLFALGDIEELEFLKSFGIGKKYDLTQIMGNKTYTKEQVIAFWDRGDNWVKSMED